MAASRTGLDRGRRARPPLAGTSSQTRQDEDADRGGGHGLHERGPGGPPEPAGGDADRTVAEGAGGGPQGDQDGDRRHPLRKTPVLGSEPAPRSEQQLLEGLTREPQVRRDLLRVPVLDVAKPQGQPVPRGQDR